MAWHGMAWHGMAGDLLPRALGVTSVHRGVHAVDVISCSPSSGYAGLWWLAPLSPPFCTIHSSSLLFHPHRLFVSPLPSHLVGRLTLVLLSPPIPPPSCSFSLPQLRQLHKRYCALVCSPVRPGTYVHHMLPHPFIPRIVGDGELGVVPARKRGGGRRGLGW